MSEHPKLVKAYLAAENNHMLGASVTSACSLKLFCSLYLKPNAITNVVYSFICAAFV